MKGSALVAALILIIIGSLIAGGLLLFIGRESAMTKEISDSVKALYIAEAGLQKAMMQSDSDWTDGDPSNQLFKLNSISETDFGSGTYKVSESWISPNLKKKIKSVGKYGNAIRIVNTDVYLDPDVDFYDQVIASCGSGHGSSKIKGNVKIMGSLYILGEEPFVDTNENSLYDSGESYVDINSDGNWGNYLDVTDAIVGNDYAFEMGGSSEIGNNYGYMPADLKSRVPTIYDGDFNWDTLNGKVMIKYGKISIDSGSCGIGVPEDPEDGVKNTMDSVVIVDGVEPDDSQIFTDELLVGEEYRDMFKNEIRMVSIKDAFTDTSTGDFYASPADPYNTDELGGYEEYLYAVANDAEDIERGVFINGDLVIDPTSSFTIGNVNDANKSGISMDGNGHLTINGLIYVNGSLTFDKNENLDDIYYSGRGSFYVRGVRNASVSDDVIVNVNILTQDAYKGAFPNNSMGVMTRENILFSGAQNHVMGAFYAEKSITMTKQYEIAGTVISSYFDMTDQVPSIYQIPELADCQPPYMITAFFPGKGPVFQNWYETYDYDAEE